MSPVKKSKKYRHIIATGKELFWKYGIRRVTVEEICEKAGASKMTFYRNFENKAALAKAILEDVMEESIEKHRELMNRDIPFSEKIPEILRMKMEGSKNMSPEFVQDIYQNDELGLRPYLEGKRAEIMREILQDYSKAQKKGEIRKDFKVEMIPVISQKIIEMALDPVVISLFDSQQSLTVELTKLFYYGLSGPNE